MTTPRLRLTAAAAAALLLAACSGGNDEAVRVPTAGATTTPVELPQPERVDDADDLDDSAQATTDAPPADTPTTEAPTTTTAPQTTAPPTTAPPTTPAPAAEEAPTTTDATIFYRQGDTAPEIEIMQLKLITLGYYSGSPDGVFDGDTNSALRTFQGDYGLGVDGVFGPLTDRALTAAANSVVVDDS